MKHISGQSKNIALPDPGSFSSGFGTVSILARMGWTIVAELLFRISPTPLFGWRRFLLNCFGATIGKGAKIYPSVKVWAPWNLEMEEGSTLGRDVDCYSVGRIKLGKGATVSQYSFLCSATHDISDRGLRLLIRPIFIGRHAWVAADAFIGPGVIVGEGAVVGARASVYKNVPPWKVVGGNPAKVIKTRVIRRRHGA